METTTEPSAVEARATQRNHTGVAYRLLRDHSPEWKFVAAWAKWIRWTGQRWQRDGGDEIINVISDIGERLREEAEVAEDKMAMKFAASVQNMGFLTSVDKRARSLFSLDADDLERSRSYFVCPNGTLDLDSGRFVRSNPRHYNVHMTSVVYNPAAEAPAWARFLADTTEGNADMQAYLQRAVGYTLSGHTGEQCMFLLHGAGANGKSVFLSALRGLFGEYGHVIRSDSLMLGNATRIPSDLAQLQYARYVETQESELGARMAEGLIKSVTGGEAISARHLYGEWFSFRPRFKLWMATNH